MSSPGSVLPIPVRAPALTVVPRSESAWHRFIVVLEQLPPAALAAAGVVAVQTVAFVAGRVLAVNLMYDVYIDSTETARMLGAVSFLSIVAIVAAIALGRRGLTAIPVDDRVTRHLATVVLGAAYLHLILWVTRTVTASVAAASTSTAQFLPNVFWWG